MDVLFSPSRAWPRLDDAQNRNAGKARAALTSVERLTSRRIRGARCFGLAYKLNGVAPQQEVCRQTITGSQPKNDLRHFVRIARLESPVRLQRIDRRAHGRLILRDPRPAC
jgi:hypothetical protein